MLRKGQGKYTFENVSLEQWIIILVNLPHVPVKIMRRQVDKGQVRKNKRAGEDVKKSYAIEQRQRKGEREGGEERGREEKGEERKGEKKGGGKKVEGRRGKKKDG